MMMFEGKKSIVFKVFYDVMDIIKECFEGDEYVVWKKVLNNVML